MSRVYVKPKEGSGAKEIVVGLDRMLQQFFLQAWKTADNKDDAPIFQEDTRSNYRLCELMRKWCDLEDPATAKAFDNVQGDWDPAGQQPGDSAQLQVVDASAFFSFIKEGK